MDGQNSSYIILLSLPVLFILVIMIISMIRFRLVPFLTKRRYLKMEMIRSDVEEYECWRQRLEDLYIEYLPLIGIFYKMIRK